jgi:hypothetical protein
MKAKGLITALLGAVLLLSLIATPALADPPAYQEDPNPPWWSGGHKAIVTDPLVGATGSGYVRFLCQSQQGFEYSIGIKGLERDTYTVKANALFIVDPDGPGPAPALPTSDGGATYTLGSIRTHRDGDGELEGTVNLPATHPFLPFGLYGWEVTVEDSTSTVVLATLNIDPADFQVFP